MKNTYRILANEVYVNNNTYETGLNNNDLIVGPSGAGKTRNYVKPNIMQCNDSMVIADTKSNLLKEVGPLLREKGYKIYHLNFKDIRDSSGYNPFDFIRYDETTGRYSEQDIMTMASVLSPITIEREQFWENAGKMYLSSFISYILECLPKEEHHLGSVYELVSLLGSKEIKGLMSDLEKENPKSFAVHQFKGFRNNDKADKMDQSIIGILQEKIAKLCLTDLLAIYSDTNRIGFQTLSEEKTAIFLSISDTDRSMDALSSLFYTQALHELCNIADDNHNSRLKIPVRFFFDDFATNTVIPDFDNVISVIRSRDIYVSIILQSITQLNGLYGDNKAAVIINNCDNCLYLGGQDLNTANFMSLKTNKPIHYILNMPLDQSYLCTRGVKPRAVKKFDITTHPNYPMIPEGAERSA